MSEIPIESKNESSELELSNEPIQYKVKSKIGYITINTKMNIINFENAQKLVAYLQEAENDPKVGCVVIRSTGDRVFSAGYDLAIFQQGLEKQVVEKVLTIGGAISRTIFFMRKPVISQIQASAIGAGSIIALSSDFRIVAKKEDLFFQLPEIDVRIFPASGPTAMAVRVLGPVHAMDMLLTGRKIFLDEFVQWGAITKLCASEDLDKEVKSFARKLAEKPLELLHLVKPAINLMSVQNAKAWYELEDEMARYYFSGFFKEAVPPTDIFLKQMWEKYGAGIYKL